MVSSKALRLPCNYLHMQLYRGMDTKVTPRSRTLGCTCMRLRKAARRVSQIYDRSLEKAGMTVTQYSLLGHIARYDGIGIGELADKLIMDPTTLTRNLRPLEHRGLVKVKADRRDRRSRCLHLTASGRAAFEGAVPAWVSAQQHIEAAFGMSETAALNDVLERVLERLAK